MLWQCCAYCKTSIVKTSVYLLQLFISLPCFILHFSLHGTIITMIMSLHLNFYWESLDPDIHMDAVFTCTLLLNIIAVQQHPIHDNTAPTFSDLRKFENWAFIGNMIESWMEQRPNTKIPKVLCPLSLFLLAQDMLRCMSWWVRSVPLQYQSLEFNVVADQCICCKCGV